MNSEELVNLKDGKYQLTDGIYDYTLTVGRNQDKTKFYAIYEKGSRTFSANILITQRIEKDEDGKKYKYLSAMAGVGGLYIHSDDIYLILSKLKFVESGSEMSLVKVKFSH